MRPLRAFHDGIFHLAVHASDMRHLFLGDSDRVRFLVLLATVFGRHRLTPITYTLMGNHYHVVLHVPDARISRAMQHVHTAYSCHHNRTHGRSAHLFRAHFAAREITTDRQLLAACRYIARNPVEAGLVHDPLAWPWSSTGAHAGTTEPTLTLDEGPLRTALGDTADWRERYRRLVTE
jgi:REP element-mobilizing transposase RayT